MGSGRRGNNTQYRGRCDSAIPYRLDFILSGTVIALSAAHRIGIQTIAQLGTAWRLVVHFL